MKKTFVINGAAHEGFGEATAREFLSNGCRVIGFYSDEDRENAERMLTEFPENLQLIQMETTELSSVKTAISKVTEEIDGFVNACFFYDMDNLDEYDVSLAEKIFMANYHVPTILAIELRKRMRTGSSIVIVTSTEAARGSVGGISYAATKAAVHNMIMSLACNWGKEKIRVNAVAAGWIGGEMDTDGPFEVSMNITPLGRLGKAEEVANAVYFLASDKSSFVNGQVMYVDGGYLCVDDIAKYEYEESQK